MHWLDPDVLPSVRGRVAVVTRNAHGDVDGFLLDDDRHVHVPPHLGKQLERALAPGETIEARYVKPRGADVLAAVSVTDAKGKTWLDEGPGPKHGKHEKHAKHDKHPEPKPKRASKPIEVAGTVRRTLHAPKGEVAGAILDSGEQLRVDPKANAELAPWFEKGAKVRVWGEAATHRGTTVVDVAEIAYD